MKTQIALFAFILTLHGISFAADTIDEIDEIENESYSCVSLGEVKFDDRAVCMGSDKKYVVKKLKTLAHAKGANAISVTSLAKCEGRAKAFDCAETFWMNEAELRKICNEAKNELQAEACLDLAFEISDREDSSTERMMLYKKACTLGHKSGCRAAKDVGGGRTVAAQSVRPSSAPAAAAAAQPQPTATKSAETYEIQKVDSSSDDQ